MQSPHHRPATVKVQKQHWPNLYIYIYIYKRYRLYCLYFFTCYIYLWIVYMLYLLICVTKLYIYSFSKKKKKSYIFIVLKVVVCFFTRKLTVMVFLKATIIIISSNWCLQYQQVVGSLKIKKFSPFKPKNTSGYFKSAQNKGGGGKHLGWPKPTQIFLFKGLAQHRSDRIAQ